MAEPGPALPPEAPLAMVRQPVHSAALPLRPGRAPWRDRFGLGLSRAVLALATLALTVFGAVEMHGVISGGGGATALQWVFLGLFTFSFGWIGFSACQCVLGFPAAVLNARAPAYKDPAPAPCTTAVLIPVYNEAPHRIAAAVEGLAEALAQRAPGCFAVFLLSDTNRAQAWMEEEGVFARLAREASPDCPIYYRRRSVNTERKAGNIADWVMRWGAGYDAMLVLDADSVMGADTALALASRLNADPGLGLLQTLPGLVRARSLFGRLQQFANRCYGPVFAAGLTLWHGSSSNYWGHNAIIRTAAFAEAAKLPILTGKPPFGGPVMSHDFIEAALLRRAGWRVELARDLGASFEEAPPSLSDVITRDRRWAQGNLQHARFVLARGLSVFSRIHLVTGILSYVSAGVWLALVACGLGLAVQANLTEPDYFAETSLFPSWPVFDSERAVQLFIIAMAVVLTPKVLGWLALLMRPDRLKHFGGPFGLTASVLTETLMSALYAPVMMLAQAGILLDILLGRDSGWRPQRRDDGAIAFAQAWRAHAGHAALGAGLAAMTLYLGLGLFLWTLPLTAGLVLAPVLSWISGMGAVGAGLRRMGVLSTPEERAGGAPELADLDVRLARWRRVEAPASLADLAADSGALAWRRAQIGAVDRAVEPEFDPHAVLAAEKLRRSGDLTAAQAWLTPAETLAVLSSPALLDAVSEIQTRQERSAALAQARFG